MEEKNFSMKNRLGKFEERKKKNPEKSNQFSLKLKPRSET